MEDGNVKYGGRILSAICGAALLSFSVSGWSQVVSDTNPTNTTLSSGGVSTSTSSTTLSSGGGTTSTNSTTVSATSKKLPVIGVSDMSNWVGKNSVVVNATVTGVYPMGKYGYILMLDKGEKQALVWRNDEAAFLKNIKELVKLDFSQGVDWKLLSGHTLPFAGKIKMSTVETGKNAGKKYMQIVVSPDKIERAIAESKI